MTEQHTPPASYILRELHDVTVPESVSWMPQTLGWKILILVAMFVLLYLTFRFACQRWHNRYRTEAMTAITRLDLADKKMPRSLFTILKVVLTYRDSRYASLFGSAFLEKLDESNPKGDTFGDEVAKQWLQSLIDPSVELSHLQRAILLERALNWVQHHD